MRDFETVKDLGLWFTQTKAPEDRVRFALGSRDALGSFPILEPSRLRNFHEQKMQVPLKAQTTTFSHEGKLLRSTSEGGVVTFYDFFDTTKLYSGLDKDTIAAFSIKDTKTQSGEVISKLFSVIKALNLKNPHYKINDDGVLMLKANINSDSAKPGEPSIKIEQLKNSSCFAVQFFHPNSANGGSELLDTRLELDINKAFESLKAAYYDSLREALKESGNEKLLEFLVDRCLASRRGLLALVWDGNDHSVYNAEYDLKKKRYSKIEYSKQGSITQKPFLKSIHRVLQADFENELNFAEDDQTMLRFNDKKGRILFSSESLSKLRHESSRRSGVARLEQGDTKLFHELGHLTSALSQESFKEEQSQELDSIEFNPEAIGVSQELQQTLSKPFTNQESVDEAQRAIWQELRRFQAMGSEASAKRQAFKYWAGIMLDKKISLLYKNLSQDRNYLIVHARQWHKKLADDLPEDQVPSFEQVLDRLKEYLEEMYQKSRENYNARFEELGIVLLQSDAFGADLDKSIFADASANKLKLITFFGTSDITRVLKMYLPPLPEAG